MKSVNSSFWLYVLGIYILLQFLWWAWMLIDLNQQIHLLEVNFQLTESLQSEAPTDGFIQRKIAMIIGEGTVFILLLTLGFIQVKKALKRENRFIMEIEKQWGLRPVVVLDQMTNV